MGELTELIPSAEQVEQRIETLRKEIRFLRALLKLIRGKRQSAAPPVDSVIASGGGQ